MNSPRKRSAPKAEESVLTGVVTGAVASTLTAMLGCQPLGLLGAGIDPSVLLTSLLSGTPMTLSELLAASALAGVSPQGAKRKAVGDEDDDADEDEDEDDDVVDDDEEEEEDEDLDEDEEDEDEEEDEDDEDDDEEEEFDDPEDDDDYDEDEDDEDFEEEE